MIIKGFPVVLEESVCLKEERDSYVKEEISRFSSHYNVRISVHPNELIASLKRAACVDTGPTTCLSDSSNLY
jgi:hypothetical protein